MIDLNLTRDELVVIQQALQLRESVQVNQNDISKYDENEWRNLGFTTQLRKKVIRKIRSLDEYTKLLQEGKIRDSR